MNRPLLSTCLGRCIGGFQIREVAGPIDDDGNDTVARVWDVFDDCGNLIMTIDEEAFYFDEQAFEDDITEDRPA